MEKEYVKYDPKFTSEKLSKMDLNKIYEQKAKLEDKLKNSEFPIMGTNGKWAKREFFESIVAAMDAEISKRTYTPKETDVPTTIEEIPIPTMANETTTGTSNADGTNVNKKLPKKSPKTVAKPKKNNYINTTNETKTTNSNGDKTMITKNEIAKIAPNAVKNILAAQNKNKTDTKKTYWGGWGKVRAGMNAAYNDYEKYQNLETEWLELRQKLGGMPSAKYHFCWGLINKNRVGVKQEPNSTLRFIKNVKIRIAMAKDVLDGKYTKKQIDEYMNGLSAAYKLKYGLV